MQNLHRQEELQAVCQVQRILAMVPCVLLCMGTNHWAFPQEMIWCSGEVDIATCNVNVRVFA